MSKSVNSTDYVEQSSLTAGGKETARKILNSINEIRTGIPELAGLNTRETREAREALDSLVVLMYDILTKGTSRESLEGDDYWTDVERFETSF